MVLLANYLTSKEGYNQLTEQPHIYWLGTWIPSSLLNLMEIDKNMKLAQGPLQQLETNSCND
jgi:hypothetical protein